MALVQLVGVVDKGPFHFLKAGKFSAGPLVVGLRSEKSPGLLTSRLSGTCWTTSRSGMKTPRATSDSQLARSEAAFTACPVETSHWRRAAVWHMATIPLGVDLGEQPLAVFLKLHMADQLVFG